MCIVCVFNKSSLHLLPLFNISNATHICHQVTIFTSSSAILLLKLIYLRSYKWYQSPNNDLGVFLSSFLLKSYTFSFILCTFSSKSFDFYKFCVKVVVFIEVLVILSVLGKNWSLETSEKRVFGWKNQNFEVFWSSYA